MTQQILNKNQYDENYQRHGYWEGYYENSNLSYKGSYINGLKHGYWEEYYRNGNLYSKGNYNNGERYGYWVVYWFNEKKYETYYL